ncbi:MAG TPA: hypothetical protein VGL80_23375 [Pseudonocardiaceae bacterium]|jgi:hypothetical protein
MAAHRDSDQHGPRADEELDKELRGLLQGNRPTRAEAWREPEADDDLEPQPGDLSNGQVEPPLSDRENPPAEGDA